MRKVRRSSRDQCLDSSYLTQGVAQHPPGTPWIPDVSEANREPKSLDKQQVLLLRLTSRTCVCTCTHIHTHLDLHPCTYLCTDIHTYVYSLLLRMAVYIEQQHWITERTEFYSCPYWYKSLHHSMPLFPYLLNRDRSDLNNALGFRGANQIVNMKLLYLHNTLLYKWILLGSQEIKWWFGEVPCVVTLWLCFLLCLFIWKFSS